MRPWDEETQKKCKTQNMGQYLTIGIVTKLRVGKERAKKQASATPEEVRDALQKAFNKTGIYSLEENEDAIWLALRPEIAEPEWIDFLHDFYNLRYPDQQTRENVVDMEEIKTRKDLKEWIEYAAEKNCHAYQLDPYVYCSIPFPRGWTNTLDTGAEQIILSIDGKIMMECFRDLFDFFESLIKERLSKYRLSDSLLVSISG